MTSLKRLDFVEVKYAYVFFVHFSIIQSLHAWAFRKKKNTKKRKNKKSLHAWVSAQKKKVDMYGFISYKNSNVCTCPMLFFS